MQRCSAAQLKDLSSSAAAFWPHMNQLFCPINKMFGSSFRGRPICCSHEQSDQSSSLVICLSSMPFSPALLQALVFTCVPHYNTASGTWRHSGRKRFASQLRPDLVQRVGGEGGVGVVVGVGVVRVRIRRVQGVKKKEKKKTGGVQAVSTWAQCAWMIMAA